jgi:hypothetical protein
LQHRHHGMTMLAADYGRWLNIAGLLRCGTSSEDGASNFFCYCLGGEGYMRGWSNERSWPAAAVWLFDGDLERWGSIALHSDGDIRNRSVTWSTVADMARPPRRVFFMATRARWSPTAGVARPPRVCAICWQQRGSLREVQIWWYHSVRWSVVLQQDYGEGSCMTVASLMRCGLFSLGSLLMSGHAGRFRRLHKSENVGGRRDKAFGPASVVEWSYTAALRFQSNRSASAVLN